MSRDPLAIGIEFVYAPDNPPMSKHGHVGRSKPRPTVSPESAGGDVLFVLILLADLRDKLDAVTEKVTRRMKKLGLSDRRFDRS